MMCSGSKKTKMLHKELFWKKREKKKNYNQRSFYIPFVVQNFTTEENEV